MKRSVSVVLIGICGAFLSFFTNCSKVDFNAASNLSKLAEPTDIEEAIRSCAQAAQDGSMKVLSTEVLFNDSRVETGNSADICSFGPSDNVSVFVNNGFNGKTAARYEQSSKLGLPANAVVCDIALSNDLSSFKYDDMIYLTYNGYVLASSSKTSVENRFASADVSLPSLAQSLRLYKFDWTRLRGSSGSQALDNYCLGSDIGVGACSLPQSEQQGQIGLAWDPKVLIAVGLSAPAEAQEFKFIVTGDNDTAKDCYHQELKLKTTVKYFLK